MKKYIYSAIAASCAILASCSQDEQLPGQPAVPQAKAVTEISASLGVESRAVVSSSDNTKIYWENNDKLRVFGTDLSNQAASADYTLSSSAGTTSGTFTNASSTVSVIQAFMYPAQSTATWDATNSKLTCNIPTVQTATEGSFDKDAAIMYHIGSESNAMLTSAVAFLKVTVSETDVHAITIYNSSALSGSIDITSSSVAAASGSAENYVTLQADGSNGALSSGTYYIAVLPGTYSNLSIAYKYTDHTAKAKASNTALTMTAGHVKAISVNFSTGTHEARQLWSGGPYFATMNLGASSVSAKGNTVSYTDAMGTGSNSVVWQWGYAWRVPTQVELDGLVGKVSVQNLKVNSTHNYAAYTSGGSDFGWTFNASESGYSGSLFLPASGGDACIGDAGYWSSTADGTDEAWRLNLSVDWGDDNSDWGSGDQSNKCYVRPVLR